MNVGEMYSGVMKENTKYSPMGQSVYYRTYSTISI